MGIASYLPSPSARSSSWQFLALLAAVALIVLSLALDAAIRPHVRQVPVYRASQAPTRDATGPYTPAITRAPASVVRPRPRGARRPYTLPS